MADRDLVNEISARKPDALEEAYRRHASVVLGVAHRVTASLVLAEDVLQEVFLRLWRGPERFDAGRGSLRSYLLIDGRARAIERVRSESARRDREYRSDRLELGRGDDVEREAWDLVLADHLREALNALGEGEREAIELAYYGGCTYRQVAEILDEPEGTIKSRIRSGLSDLHDRLLAVGIGGGAWHES